MTVDTEYVPLQEALLRVGNDVGFIEKNLVNGQSRYNARGIDDVMAAFHDPLILHGVTVKPAYKLLKSEYVGGNNHAVTLEGSFTFVKGDEEYTIGPFIGHASDTSDKAANQGMQSSMKYAFLQAFVVPTGATDADSKSPPNYTPAAQPQQTGSPVAQMAQSQPAPTTNLQNRVAQAAQQSAPVQQSQSGGEPAMSDGQSRNLFRLYKHVLHWERERYFQEVELVLGKTITSDKELTKRDASEMIRSLKILAGEPVDDGGPSNQGQGRPIANEPEPQYASEGQLGHSEGEF
jgi:hypothetical protein